MEDVAVDFQDKYRAFDRDVREWGVFVYLRNDIDKFSTSLYGNLSFRIVRGLSVFVNASTSLVRDQVYLAKSDLTDEEILIERRQLATDSRYRISFGFSYTFGSIFNNVVNPRF